MLLDDLHECQVPYIRPVVVKEPRLEETKKKKDAFIDTLESTKQSLNFKLTIQRAVEKVILEPN